MDPTSATDTTSPTDTALSFLQGLVTLRAEVQNNAPSYVGGPADTVYSHPGTGTPIPGSTVEYLTIGAVLLAAAFLAVKLLK